MQASLLDSPLSPDLAEIKPNVYALALWGLARDCVNKLNQVIHNICWMSE